jgi:DNA-nicking Smr family endonuclease
VYDLGIAMGKKQGKEETAETGQTPFSQLSQLLKQAGVKLRADAEPKPVALPRTPPPVEEKPVPEDTGETFESAMKGVSRVRWRRDPAPATSLPQAIPVEDPEGEDERLFLEAVGPDAAPPILDHPEYIEGWVGLAGQRFLASLRNGVYSIQAAIDLHGMSRMEARAAVEEFIIGMSRQRSCCVKIIHGRGINSPNDKAVLKEHLQDWLATRRMSHHVVAYASAPYTDGGVGAIYVLLRRYLPH